MNTTKWMGLFAAAALSAMPVLAQVPPPPEGQVVQAPPPGKPEAEVQVNISPAAAEIVRLAESGLGDEVVSSYVTNSRTAFSLTADDIVYLKDVGISESIISLMMAHDRQIRESGPPPVTAQTPPPAVPPQPNEVATPPNAPPPEYVSNPPPEVNYFYSDLAPYGAWIEVSGIGWCWQPHCVVINHAWQPYCDYGHWAYTDCGWYWQSSYSWGWAPFHYGRWHYASCGWVWMPDRVWGPAWVTWRVAGDHCGWAPLPPFTVVDAHGGWFYRGAHVSVNFDFGLPAAHFTFVAFHDFGERDVWRHRMPRTEVTRIYNNTTVINNYTINHNTVVNHGVSVERVSAESRTRIQHASIRDVPSDRRPERPGAVGTSDRHNVVYRHELPSSPKPAQRVVAQKVDAKQPVVYHPPIVSTRTDTHPTIAARQGQNYNGDVNRNGTANDRSHGVRLGNPNRPPSQSSSTPQSAPNRYTPTERSTVNEGHNSERAPVVTPPNAPRQTPNTRESTAVQRNVERTPVTPQSERANPRQVQPSHESTLPRTVERGALTPPSAPRDYQSVPRSAPPAREYQQVPRSPQVYGDQPSRSGAPRSSAPENRGLSPQYYPKGYQQSSEIHSTPRQSAPVNQPPVRSGEDGRGSNGNSSNSNGKHDRDH